MSAAYPSFLSVKHAYSSIATRFGWDASPSQGCPQQHVAGTHLYTWVNRDKVSDPCLRKQGDGQGLNSRPCPDPGGLPNTSTNLYAWHCIVQKQAIKSKARQ